METFIDRDNHTGGSIVSSQKVGPSIADDIKTGAIYSVVLALLAIGLYILLRFRNIAYSIGSIVALSCDTIMIIGAHCSGASCRSLWKLTEHLSVLSDGYRLLY